MYQKDDLCTSAFFFLFLPRVFSRALGCGAPRGLACTLRCKSGPWPRSMARALGVQSRENWQVVTGRHSEHLESMRMQTQMVKKRPTQVTHAVLLTPRTDCLATLRSCWSAGARARVLLYSFSCSCSRARVLVLECSRSRVRSRVRARVLIHARARASYVGRSKPHKLLKSHGLADVANNPYDRFCVLCMTTMVSSVYCGMHSS